MKKLLWIFVLILVLSATNVVADIWVENTSIITGLADAGTQSTPYVYNDGGLKLITGAGLGGFFGYFWNETTWSANTTLVEGLVDVGVASAPCVFNMSGTWKLTTAGSTPAGYQWDGINWTANSSIISGLTLVGRRAHSFYDDGSLKIIVGSAAGTFTGYQWNGTSWVSNSSIIAGLGTISEGYTTPTIYYDGAWKLISGHDVAGPLYGFEWNGTSWVSNSELVNGLPNTGIVGTTPNVFNDSGTWKLIMGKNTGTFYGYYLVHAPNIIYPTNTTYDENVSTINYTLSTSSISADSCWYSTDGGATNETPVAAGTNFTEVQSTAGSNTWTVYCNYTDESVGDDSVSFSINNMWFNTNESEKSFAITQFIDTSGNQFTLAGQPYAFQGADSYYLADYGTNLTYDDDGHEITNSQQYVLEILNKAKYLNINVIRTWANMQGSETGVWIIGPTGGHYNLFERGVPGNYSEEMFASMDWVLSEASKRDIRLQMVLVNNWNDYGGMRWYVQQSPTTNKTYENVTDDTSDNWSLFHDQFYTDENARTYYRNFINYTLNRNNTITGTLYKDDPAIFSWMLANEPRAKSDPEEDNMLIINWTINMTAYIKSIDTNHLVGLGIEGWGDPWEGTSFVDDHNGTGVDFATFELHPEQWDWFAQRSENETNEGWVIGGVNSTQAMDWWTTGENYSYNNRYEGSYIPNYNPALARHEYKNWIAQNVEWANDLGMPVLLQEMAMPTNSPDAIKDRFYDQAIYNFYNDGGDGLLYWNLNHDNYYFSTDTPGDMDDGYSFYLSDNTTLKTLSQSTIDAFAYTLTNNTGGTSWVDYLNNYKYNFVIDVSIPNDVTLNNCSLILNVYNGSWTGNYTDQTEDDMPVNEEYTFVKQFASTDQELYWHIECFANDVAYLSDEQYIQLLTYIPIVTLSNPDDGAYFTNSEDFNYSVTNDLAISYCEFYIDDVLNITNTGVTAGETQKNTVSFATPATHTWYVECTDIADNVGTSEVRTANVNLTISCSGDWDDDGSHGCELAYDGDWGTYGQADSGEGNAKVYFNYLKPENVTGDVVTWRTKMGDEDETNTVPVDCWNTTYLQLYIGSDEPSPAVDAWCYNTSSSTWKVLETDLSNPYVYEQELTWGQTDTCSYLGSGDWVITVSDNCTISDDYNLLGNNITFNGTGGSVTINSTIYNWTTATGQGGALVTVTQGGRLG